MPITLKDKMKELSSAQRKKVEARAAVVRFAIRAWLYTRLTCNALQGGRVLDVTL
jgi:hypothetical protein